MACKTNEKKKMQFISTLAKHLQLQSHSVIVSSGDANTLIMLTALEFAPNGQAVTVVGEYTDVFIMLLYHWNTCMSDILLWKEGRRSKARQIYSMKKTYNRVSQEIRKYIFIYAWSGCNTMSATYGHEKTNLVKQLKKSTDVQIL